jgi:peptide chain release factor 1
MFLRRFRQLINRNIVLSSTVSKNSYYSSHVNQLFLAKADIYAKKIDEDQNSSASNLRKLFMEFNKLLTSIGDVGKEIGAGSDDKELMALMKEEHIELEKEKKNFIEKILNEIDNFEQTKDINRIPSNSGCIFEISSAVGGRESQLFASELCLMYNQYFDSKCWVLSEVESDLTEGEYLRHFKARIEGYSVWDHMKYEIGVHRVQRIPKTEAKGRQVPVSVVFHYLSF